MRTGLTALLVALSCIVSPSVGRAQGVLTTLYVTSDPTGAAVELNGVRVGRTPLLVTEAPGREVVVEVRRDGFEPARETLALTEAGSARLAFVLAPSPPTIAVNTGEDLAPAPDGLVTLREALLYAEGRAVPLGLDRLQVSGLPGAQSADRILIGPAALGPAALLTVAEPLPPLASGDRIEAVGGAVLSPEPGSAVRVGLELEADTEVHDLIVDGFESCVRAAGDGRRRLVGVVLSGCAVAVDASDGAVVDARSSALEPLLAAIAETRWATVLRPEATGVAASPSASEATVVAPDGSRHVHFAGRFPPLVEEPTLFVRHRERNPLHQTPDLIAEASSIYDEATVFFGSGQQHWPSYAVDGQGRGFQWRFTGPAEGEWLRITSPTALAAQRFEVRQTDDGGRLHRYDFALTDHTGAEVFSTTVDSNGDSDVIDVGEEVTYFAIEIVVREAEGATPGVSEIVSDTLGSDALRPAAFSEARIAFRRPEPGRSALLRVGASLYQLEEAAVTDGHRFALDAYGARPSGAQLVIPIEDPLDRMAPDGVWSVREALAFLRSDYTPTGDERARLSGEPADQVRIELLVDALAFPDEPVALPDMDLSIQGGPTRVTGGTLTFRDVRRLGLNDLHAQGPVTCVACGRVEVRRVHLDVSSPGDVGFDVEANALLVADSTVTGGTVGITSTGSTWLVGVVATDVETGAALAAGWTHVLVDNRFERVARPLTLADGAGGVAAPLLLVGNRAEDPLAAVSGEPRAQVLAAENTPPRLGLPEGPAPSVASLRLAPDVLDLAGAGRPALVFVDGGDVLARVAGATDRFPLRGGEASYALLLQDRDVRLLLGGARGAQWLDVPLEGPGLVRLAVQEPTDWGGQSALAPAPPLDVERRSVAAGLVPFDSDSTLRAELRRTLAELRGAGDHRGAFLTVWRLRLRDPGIDRDEVLFQSTLAAWIGALEETGQLDQAEAVLTSLQRRLPESAALVTVYASFLARRADAALSASDWATAIARLDGQLELEPENAVARNNLVFAIQESGRARLTSEPPSAVLAWLAEAAERRPALALDIRRVGAVIFAETAAAASDGGDHERALGLILDAWGLDQSAIPRSNVLVVFQRLAGAELSEGRTDAAFEVFEHVRDALGEDDGDVADALVEAAIGPAQAWISDGRQAEARQLSLRIYATRPTERAEDLLVLATQEEARTHLPAAPDAALDVWTDSIENAPDSDALRESAAAVANDAALERAAGDDFATAVGLLQRGLALSPEHPTLTGNLRIVYANWSVALINAGAAAEAIRVLEGALERFPGDPDLLDYLRIARERAQTP